MKRYAWVFALLLVSFILSSSVSAETKSEESFSAEGRATGGPDTFGYTYLDRLSPGGTEDSYNDISGTDAGNFDDDSIEGPFNIGFDFNYYGVTYNQFYICSNGFIRFTTPTGGTCGLSPGGTNSDGFIAGWWVDFNPDCEETFFGGVFYDIEYQTLGTAPNRQLIINFNSLDLFSSCSTSPFDRDSNFNIILHETSNAIQVVHDTSSQMETDGTTNYVGIDQPTGASQLLSFSGNGIPSGGGEDFNVQFFPPPENLAISGAEWSCASPRSAIPDNNTTGVSSDIVVSSPNSFVITDLDIHLNIGHTFVGDLEVTLEHVDTGTSISLLDNQCGSNKDIAGLIFNDEAAGASCGASSGVGIQGNFTPDGSLSDFDDEIIDGTWRLKVVDTAGFDVGTLMQWCVRTDASVLPVTLNFLTTEKQADGSFIAQWQTATETANLGFNFYAETADGLKLLNDSPIASKAFSTAEPTDYSHHFKQLPATTFYIEEINAQGATQLHGPFSADTKYGEKIVANSIDWAAISAEHDAKAQLRNTDLQQEATNTIRSRSNGPILNIEVADEGIQRLTHADLLAAGFDLTGVNSAEIAITSLDGAVPIKISGNSGIFGPSNTIEFVGGGVDTLYTDTNIYTLHLDPTLALTMPQTNTVATGASAIHYIETVQVGEQNAYDVVTPARSPWSDARLVSSGNAVSKQYTLAVDHLLTNTVTATLSADVWGGLNFPTAPDHHAVVELNGAQVADVQFDGISAYQINAPLSTLTNGDQTIKFTVPGDTGEPWDIVGIQQIALHYPRAFVAKAGAHLTFSAAGEAFTVQGFTSGNLSVYRLLDGSVTQLTALDIVEDSGSFSVTFAGLEAAATYFVQTHESLVAPTLTTVRPKIDLLADSADYLMISHADFIADIAPLVAHHEANGLTVKVVDVADIYANYSHHMVAPEAIQAFISDAAAQLGIQYVLLVGSDTYDYFDNLELGSVSFIPSYYAQTGPLVRFAPVDPLYADIDGDQLPDLPIGRFPVRTSLEAQNLVTKTLQFANTVHDPSAIFSADLGFSDHSSSLANQLDDWHIKTAYLDNVSASEANDRLVQGMNANPAVTAFFGHSGPTTWSWQGLFSASDAADLTNSAPGMVAQFGCWNTYYVAPTFDTLSHEFMTNDGGGAALVLGGATLTNSTSDLLIGAEMMTRLGTSGLSIGDILQQSKVALADRNRTDIQLGYTLLGDPAVVLQTTPPTSVEMGPISAETITPSSQKGGLGFTFLGFVLLLVSTAWTVVNRPAELKQ